MHAASSTLLTVTSEPAWRRVARRATVGALVLGAAAAVGLTVEARHAEAAEATVRARAAHYANEVHEVAPITCATWPRVGAALEAKLVDYLAITARQARDRAADYMSASRTEQAEILGRIEALCTLIPDDHQDRIVAQVMDQIEHGR
jgi:hypothetical protein